MALSRCWILVFGCLSILLPIIQGRNFQNIFLQKDESTAKESESIRLTATGRLDCAMKCLARLPCKALSWVRPTCKLFDKVPSSNGSEMQWEFYKVVTRVK
ncbi:uncharacterized protein LOC141911414 [Tubulanus polymorphus]|uniref:uncharacterized protein LOC141911414 n=1 Tax=Tubulanus polymorphus TaxID=672921 RepID=UPI003DA1DC52